MFLFCFLIAFSSCLIWDGTDFDTIFMYGDNEYAQCGVENYESGMDIVDSADMYIGKNAVFLKRKKMSCSTSRNTVTVFAGDVVGILGKCSLIDRGDTGECHTAYDDNNYEGADDYQQVTLPTELTGEITGLWCGRKSYFLLTDDGKLWGSGDDDGQIVSGSSGYVDLTEMSTGLSSTDVIEDLAFVQGSSDDNFVLYAIVNDTATGVSSIYQRGYDYSYYGSCLTSSADEYTWYQCNEGFFGDFTAGTDYTVEKVFSGYYGWWMTFSNGTESGVVYAGTSTLSGVYPDHTTTISPAERIDEYSSWSELKDKDIESIHCFENTATSVSRSCVSLVGQADIYTWGAVEDADTNYALCPANRVNGMDGRIPIQVTHNIEDVYEAVTGYATVYISGNSGNSLFACGSNADNQISSEVASAYNTLTVTGRHLLANGYKRFCGGYGAQTIYMGGRASFFTASLFVFAVVFFLFQVME